MSLNPSNAVFPLHAFSTFFMTGVIWIVQIVQYPSFGRTRPSDFRELHSFHSERITWIVGPVMMIQLASAVLLRFGETGGFPTRSESTAFLALSLGAFAATGLLSVPCHRTLSRGFEPSAWTRLVATNWLRTGIWSVHSGWIVLCLCRWMSGVQR